MKKYAAFLLSISIVMTLVFGISSCKDDEPPTKPKLSFAESAMTVTEGEGVIEVQVVLDKAYGKDLRIEYDLGGTASDQDVVGTALADYQVNGDHGVVVIEAGETTGIIEIEILDDAAFEENETIEISIVDTNTSDVELTAEDEMEITISSDDLALQLSFSSPTMTVNEADREIEVTLVLDKPAPQNITIQYELSGSAKDTLTAVAQKVAADYKIIGTPGQFVINAGETSGVIDIRLYSDLSIEDGDPETDPLDPETIVISVTNTNGVEMIDTEMEILVEQEDGLLIFLFWPDPAADSADMDLLLRVGTTTTNWLGVIAGSASDSFTGPEAVFIPNAITFPAYGVSYTYYAGTLDPLEFDVVFADLIDGALEPEANTISYQATYTAANKNPWTDVSTTKVVQTFEKTATGFTAPSAIAVPTTGSRVASHDNFTSTLRRGNIHWSNNLNTMFLKRYQSN